MVQPFVYSDYLFKTAGHLDKRLIAEDPQTRIAAHEQLKALDTDAKKTLTPKLLRTLMQTDSMKIGRHTYETFKDLGSALGETAVPLLINALQDEDKAILLRAVLALAQVGSEAGAAVPALIQALEDPTPDVRRMAPWALEQVGPTAIAAVLDALHSESRELRIGAACGFYGKDRRAKEAVPLLLQMAQDPDRDIGNAAVMALHA